MILIICLVLLLILCVAFWVAIKDLEDDIKYLEQITPSRHKGHWLRITTVNPKEFCNLCSECGYEQFYAERYKFCPNCGACMKDGRTLDEFIEDSKEKEEQTE